MTDAAAPLVPPAGEIAFVIPGEPNAQRRMRMVNMGKFTRQHPDKRDGVWRGYAQVHMQEAMKGFGLFACPLSLHVRAIFECPASKHHKRGPAVPRDWFQGRKDVDNIAKAVQDAGNAVLWIDDRQVVRLVVEKVRGAQGEAPRVEVTVKPAVAWI